MTREVLAATLIIGGTAAASWGAALVLPAAGFVVLGALLLAVGIALGFGDVGVVEAEEVQRTARFIEGEPVAVAGPPATSSAPTPTVPTAVPTPPFTVPVDRYIGVREPRPVEVVKERETR